MKRRRRTIVLLMVAGIVMLVAATVAPDGTYTQGLLLNLGTGILLFAVLYLTQQNILSEVREVEQRTASSVEHLTEELAAVREEVQAKLGDVGEQTRQILEEQLAGVAQSFSTFATAFRKRAAWQSSTRQRKCGAFPGTA